MTRRVALIAPADSYVGPELARALAARDHDLVLADPAPELVDELTSAGVRVDGSWSAFRPVMRPSDMPPPCSCT